MKKLLFSISTILLVNMTSAQTPSFQWAKQINGSTSSSKSSAIKVDASGNVYTVGHYNGTVDFDPGAGTYSLTSNGGEDVFITKLDATGNFVWVKSIGGINDDISTSLALDIYGNLCITGNFNGTVDFDSGSALFSLSSFGNADVFVLKLDATGAFLWAKQLGGTNTDEATSIATDKFGNVYTTGYFKSSIADFDPSSATYTLSPGYGSNASFVSKLNQNGDFIYAKAFIGVYTGSVGGEITSKSFAVDSLGNVFSTGYFNGTIDFDPSSSSSYTLSTVSWASNEMFISKLDLFGDFVWAKKIQGAGGNSICIDGLNNIYTTGNFSSTRDFDPGFSTYTITSKSSYDIFILKLNSIGDFVWVNSIGDISSSNTSTSIIADKNNDIYICGDFAGTVDFDPGVGVQSLTSQPTSSYYNGYVIKLNSSANFIWLANIGGTPNSTTLNGLTNVYSAGYFIQTLDYDPSSSVFNLTGDSFHSRAFVHKMSQTLVGLKETNKDLEIINIYPNPTNSNFTIKSSNNEKQLLQIVDITGNVVLSQNLIGDSVIDASSLANGVYTVLVSNNQFSSTNKLVIIK